MLVEAMLPPVLVNGTAIALLHAGGAQPPLLTDTAATALYICSARAGSRARRSCCGHTLCTGRAAACARRSCCRHTPCTCSSSAAARARREAAAAAAFPALAAQPPMLAGAACLAPHGPQTMRARCATNSQRTKRLARPNRRARRQQIPDPKREVWGGEKTAAYEEKSADFCLPPENSRKALLQISVQRRRSQIAQITSHRRCAREKQKSGAAVGICRVSDPAKEIPFFLKRAI